MEGEKSEGDEKGRQQRRREGRREREENDEGRGRMREGSRSGGWSEYVKGRTGPGHGMVYGKYCEEVWERSCDKKAPY